MQQKSELPEGWAWADMFDIFVWSNGKNLPKKNMESGNYLVYGGNGINGHHTKWLSSEECVVIGRVGANCGNVHLAKPKSWITDNAIYSSWASKNVYLKYFLFFLSDCNLNEYASGSGQPYVSQKTLASQTIMLPPLTEQHRIVSAIEALFARLDATNEKLDSVLGILKKFRESVLAAACDGRLTEGWREKNVNKEDISIFFESIKKKRMECWEKENLEKFVSNGKMSQNDKWKQKYKAPENTQNFDSFTLPDEWISVTIEQIASKVTDGDHNPPKRVEKGVPHLTARNIKNWEITFDNCTYISPDDFEVVKTRYNPQKDDLIITCVGTIGETAIVSDNLVFSADRNLAVIRLTENGANPRFVQYTLNAPVWRDIMKKGSGSTAQPHLYLKDIRALTIPLPPFPEQEEIVRRVDTLFAFADSIEAKVAAAREKTEKLRQSILAKAFSGQLVETEAAIAKREGRDYETAEVLLEKIKAEKGIKDKKK